MPGVQTRPCPDANRKFLAGDSQLCPCLSVARINRPRIPKCRALITLWKARPECCRFRRTWPSSSSSSVCPQLRLGQGERERSLAPLPARGCFPSASLDMASCCGRIPGRTAHRTLRRRVGALLRQPCIDTPGLRLSEPCGNFLSSALRRTCSGAFASGWDGGFSRKHCCGRACSFSASPWPRESKNELRPPF